MSDTGPTGSTEQTIIESTGPTGPSAENSIVESTGPTWPLLFPSAENSIVEPPHIATLEELMASHAVVVAKEATDRSSLTPLVNPSRDQYRPRLFQWAAAGFPGIYIVQSITLTPPDVCSDGVTRDVSAYFNYLTESDMGQVVANIQSMMTGILVSFSFLGNDVRVHVSKIEP